MLTQDESTKIHMSKEFLQFQETNYADSVFWLQVIQDLVAPLVTPNLESECLDCKLCCTGLPRKTTTQVYTHPINLGCSMSFSLLNLLIPVISLGWSFHYLD